MKQRTGFAAIIGRPNVGKSTLLNAIIGQKIVIATDKPQTTRRRIKGIYTSEKGQIVFIDTPGIYKPWDKFGEVLFDEAKMSVPDADVILFVADASEPAGKGDKWIAENILKTQKHDLAISIHHRPQDVFEIINDVNKLGLGYKFQVGAHSAPRNANNVIMYATVK